MTINQFDIFILLFIALVCVIIEIINRRYLEKIIEKERRDNAKSFATFLRLLDGLDDSRIRDVLKREIEIYDRKLSNLAEKKT